MLQPHSLFPTEQQLVSHLFLVIVSIRKMIRLETRKVIRNDEDKEGVDQKKR